MAPCLPAAGLADAPPSPRIEQLLLLSSPIPALNRIGVPGRRYFQTTIRIDN
ncbi:unnamed protein product [Penicillium camemberti]|uniref:Str. FM013 n=1 Tax=Penicillium camemberti (strain FM 013) TaxID=1429867 RepID=A0A0G4PJU3_PENC3|nr:unnamed protein product [Penicillium camemberti]